VGGLAVANGGSSEVMDISQVTWRKASYSGANGGECVEVASTGKTLVAVRDSKDPDGPNLAFTPRGWQSFIQRVRNTSLDAG
jgi:Domain of unknown function (DUF397)